MKKKTLALLLSVVLVIGVVAGSSLAWLTAKDEPVVNVFTPSNIEITLTEDTKTHDETTDYRFKMVPGDTFAKDPKVKVETGSEACWLFVAITESENLDTFITYDVANGWTQLEVTKDGVTTKYENIYWRSVGGNDINKDFYILAGQGDGELKNGCVTVNTTVTKSDMETIIDDPSTETQPTLTFNACAVQSAHLETVEKAWEQANSDFVALAKKVTP